MNTQEFIAKLDQEFKENNLVLAQKIADAGNNPDAVYAIAQDAGVTDSFEVFQTEMRAHYEALSEELSEEELAGIAGGSDDETYIAILAGVVFASAFF